MKLGSLIHYNKNECNNYGVVTLMRNKIIHARIICKFVAMDFERDITKSVIEHRNRIYNISDVIEI